MLKKLAIASAVLMASSTIAFADDTSDSMGSMPTDNSAATSTTETTQTTEVTSSTTEEAAPAPSSTPKATHARHKKAKHKRHHHKKQKSVAVSSESSSMDNSDSAVAASTTSYKGDYKGEVSQTPVCPSCEHSPLIGGFYAGLGVGSLVSYTQSPVAYTGAQGTLFGGYGFTWDDIYTGLELFVQDNASINNYSNALGSAASTWGYGFSVLPGYVLSDNLLGYLRLGVIGTRFKTGNQTKTGGQVGVGLQSSLNTNWDLRGEWIYSFYNSLATGTVGNPKSQQFNLGLIYKFGA